jgi:hypothetical protein
MELTTGSRRRNDAIGINGARYRTSGQRRRALSSERNEQLINGKRSSHCVHRVLTKSSAIVTVKRGAGTGVWGLPLQSKVMCY